MDKYEYGEYSFTGLTGLAGEIGNPNLAYLVGLVNSPDHGILNVVTARRILNWLYEVEEQMDEADQLVDRQEIFFSRYFSGGYFPQTPCMLVQRWSPLGAMIERGFQPVALNKAEILRQGATGIWEAGTVTWAKPIEECGTDVDLFWTIIHEAFHRAKERKMWISIIALPGYMYSSAAVRLQAWESEEVQKADRILWKSAVCGRAKSAD